MSQINLILHRLEGGHFGLGIVPSGNFSQHEELLTEDSPTDNKPFNSTGLSHHLSKKGRDTQQEESVLLEARGHCMGVGGTVGTEGARP